MRVSIFNLITKTILPNAGLIASVFVVGGISGVAAIKVSDNLPIPKNVVEKVNEIKEKTGEFVNGSGTVISANSEDNRSEGSQTVKPTNAGCVVTIDGEQFDVIDLRKTHSGGDIFKCNTDMSALYHSTHGYNLTRMQRYLIKKSSTAAGGTNVVRNTNVTSAGKGANLVFTSSQLATHNTRGSCYVAYNGKVYDVSNHSSWAGCRHHGVIGGQDITSVFPHPTSYFSSLPIVGTYQNSGNTNNTNENTNKSIERKYEDDYEEEDHRENEYRDEDKSIDSKALNPLSVLITYLRHMLS